MMSQDEKLLRAFVDRLRKTVALPALSVEAAIQDTLKGKRP